MKIIIRPFIIIRQRRVGRRKLHLNDGQKLGQPHIKKVETRRVLWL